MVRHEVAFADLWVVVGASKKRFIDYKGDYYPVYSKLVADADGRHTVEIDLICGWRLIDGRVLFLSVRFDTEEQLNEIIQYLKDATERFYKQMLRNIDDQFFLTVGKLADE